MRRHGLILLLLFAFLPGAPLISLEQLRCHVCGILIPEQAKYYRVRGGSEVYCERCFAEAPRCILCRLPTAPGELDPESGVCSRCLAKLPRCRICGKPIIGTAYSFPSVRGIFCEECRNSRPSCYICGAPVGDDFWKYPDGRIICGDCGDRAVIDVGEIHRIMDDARKIIEKRLRLHVELPYDVKVEKLGGLPSSPLDQVARIAANQSPLYGNELGMYYRKGDRSEIFLLFGLPPEMLYEAAAHEYAHAWQAENCPPDLTPELREGFAQWVAADVLRAKGYQNALQKLEMRADTPYGTGYHRLRGLRQRVIMELLERGR